jgi:glycine oxidase
MEQRRWDVVVVGTGVIGLATARELARAGLSVTVLERGQPGREASRAAAGIVCPTYPWKEPPALAGLVHWSRALFPVLCEDLRRQTGVDPEWRVGGMLMFDADERDRGAAWARGGALPFEMLDAAGVARCEPALAGGKRDALFLPTVGQVHTARLLRALNESVMHEGVPVRQFTEVIGLVREGGKVTGVKTREGELLATHTVIAAGAWSEPLLATAELALPMIPVHGQLIQYDGPPGLLSRILVDRDHYVLQRRNGQIVVGSTKEKVGYEIKVTEAAQTELTKIGGELLPMLARATPNRQWANLRPGTPDEVPYIGAHPDAAGLWINAGHFRNGITVAPAAARLLADLLLGKMPIMDPTPYALARPRLTAKA